MSNPVLPAGSGSASVNANAAAPVPLRGFHWSVRSPLFQILFCTFCMMTSFAMVLPATSDLVVEYVYRGNVQQAALFLALADAIVAVMQFFADPLWGHLSDNPSINRKPMLIMAHSQYAVELYMIYAYPTFWVILGMAFLRGITGVGFTICAIMTFDLSGAHPKLGATYMGYFGAAAGLALILGAASGAALGAVGGVRLPFLVAGIVMTVCTLFDLVFVPFEKYKPEVHAEDVLNEDGVSVSGPSVDAAAGGAESSVSSSGGGAVHRQSSAQGQSNGSSPSTPYGGRSRSGSESEETTGGDSSAASAAAAAAEAHDYNASYSPFLPLRIFNRTPTLFYLSVAFFLLFCSRAYARTFLLWLRVQFGWDMVSCGLFLCFLGIVASAVQAFALKWCLAAWGEAKTMWVSLWVGFAGTLVWMVLPAGSQGATLLYVTVLLTCLAFVLLPILRAALSREVTPAMQGLLGGASASLCTAANVLGAVVYGSTFAFFTTGAHDHVPHAAAGAETMPTLKGAPFAWPGAFFLFSALLTLAAVPVLRRGLQEQEKAANKKAGKQNAQDADKEPSYQQEGSRLLDEQTDDA